MSDVKRLLEAATPLPWHAADRGIGWEVHSGDQPPHEWGPGPDCVGITDNHRDLFSDADAALIVYAVNRLPDYEAAVDALEALFREVTDGWGDDYTDAMRDAEAILSRLSQEPSE